MLAVHVELSNRRDRRSPRPRSLPQRRISQQTRHEYLLEPKYVIQQHTFDLDATLDRMLTTG